MKQLRSTTARAGKVIRQDSGNPFGLTEESPLDPGIANMSPEEMINSLSYYGAGYDIPKTRFRAGNPFVVLGYGDNRKSWSLPSQQKTEEAESIILRIQEERPWESLMEKELTIAKEKGTVHGYVDIPQEETDTVVDGMDALSEDMRKFFLKEIAPFELGLNIALDKSKQYLEQIIGSEVDIAPKRIREMAQEMVNMRLMRYMAVNLGLTYKDFCLYRRSFLKRYEMRALSSSSPRRNLFRQARAEEQGTAELATTTSRPPQGSPGE